MASFRYSHLCTCLLIFCRFNLNRAKGQTGYHNIALRKPTKQYPRTYCTTCPSWQRYCKEMCHESTLAVDGDRNADVDSGHCSKTTGADMNSGAWWTVDFEGFFYLLSINITNRNDVTRSKILRHQLKMMTIWGRPRNEPIYANREPDTRYYDSVIQLQIPEALQMVKFSGINISIPGYNTSGSYERPFLTLCEVEVFLAPNCTVPSISNGMITWSKSASPAEVVPLGTNLTLSCNDGFTSTNDTDLSCESNGVSNGLNLPQCTVVKCPTQAKSGLNYQITSPAEQYIFNMTLAAKCRQGYELVSGNLSRTCLADGSWSGEEPFCTIVKCPYPNTTAKGRYFLYSSGGPGQPIQRGLNKQFKFNSTLKFECNVGYVIADRYKHVRVCLEDGTWSDMEPICKAQMPSSSTKASLSGMSTLIGVLIGAGAVLLLGTVTAFLKYRRKNSIATAHKEDKRHQKEKVVDCSSDDTEVRYSTAAVHRTSKNQSAYSSEYIHPYECEQVQRNVGDRIKPKLGNAVEEPQTSTEIAVYSYINESVNTLQDTEVPESMYVSPIPEEVEIYMEFSE